MFSQIKKSWVGWNTKCLSRSFSSENMKISCTMFSRWSAQQGLDYMIFRGPSQPHPFCDCLTLKMKRKGCLMGVPKRDSSSFCLVLTYCLLKYNLLHPVSEGAGSWVTCTDDSAEQEEKKGWCIFSCPWRLWSTSQKNTISYSCHLLSTSTPTGWCSIPAHAVGAQRFVWKQFCSGSWGDCWGCPWASAGVQEDPGETAGCLQQAFRHQAACVKECRWTTCFLSKAVSYVIFCRHVHKAS